jgi:hypothetical protein
MPGDAEIPIGMRQWVGVNLEDDPTTLPPNQLQKCQNFIPAPTYALRKRPGTASFVTWASNAGHPPLGCTSMVRAIDNSGSLYLYGYVQHVGGDALQVSINGGAPAVVTGGVFASTTATGRLHLMNATIYAGNGVDPMKRALVGGTASNLAPPGLGNDTGQSAVLTADAASELLTGQYSYRWAVYDTSTQSFPFIAPVETVTVSGRNGVTFTAPQAGAPATVLTGTQKWHLFVADVNNPIEFAFDQTATGLAAAATFLMSTLDQTSTPVPIPSTLSPTGNQLIDHLGRLFFAGDQNNKRLVRATNVLLQGLEQQLFNQADFFPANAFVQVDDTVTGIGIASLSTAGQSPTGPLVVTTKGGTWLLIGDILNDPTESFIQISDSIGCVAFPTMVNTPVGLIMLGTTSVYLVVPETTEPVDIGWPIETAIRQLTALQQAQCTAAYHQGFYKLCIPGAGAVTNTTEWWLDLRPRMRGTLTTFPSWWGPMLTAAPLTAIATSVYDAAGDVGFGAIAGGGTVVLLQQAGVFTDNGTTIQSSIITARHTGGAPFLRKRVKRVRAIVQVGAMTLMPTTIRVDQNQTVTSALDITQVPGGIWDVGIWDVAVWGSDIFQEADTQTGPTPIAVETQGQAMEVQIDHNLHQDIILRDLELRWQIIQRQVA